ncbi:hypothetical protein ABOM_001804 [Aspergillus bombycis]|uniref:2-oxoadipate dioxygenase/decarboxylase n=1 Tax=Aspergillus bombycis TaxID=109264 RepID=A0A1F8ADD3_9EURO|nr:hypothetical protein ABOM_001804 [Aspergillus bombycis]OGM49687.1 hypothetical protein ABOM_001804 [Aspergillus bombycis]
MTLIAAETRAAMYVDSDVLRTRFATAMSTMYRTEVPLYGDLIEIVRDVNMRVLRGINENGQPGDAAGISASSERLTLERHGAIRLGTAHELRIMKRIFTVLGMHPIGYYDLSMAGLPMHATCFRPMTLAALDRNPFRVFTTLLRPELLASEQARQLSMQLLDKRNIFSDALIQILAVAEAQDGRLTEDQSKTFIIEALPTFSWQSIAAATFDEYKILRPSIRSWLILHPVQSAMRAAGMAVKAHIEGPPARDCPILLRQTSFLALDETVHFRGSTAQPQDKLVKASHRARFGEIEQRGAAVTPKGQALYDRLLRDSQDKSAGVSSEEADALILQVFQRYPDTWTELRSQGLIYVEFRVARNIKPEATFDKDASHGSLLGRLIADGVLEALPLTYEDFLPFSAAGIFQSNLQADNQSDGLLCLHNSLPDQEGFERALGMKVSGLDQWYVDVQQQSLETVSHELGLRMEELLK